MFFYCSNNFYWCGDNFPRRLSCNIAAIWVSVNKYVKAGGKLYFTVYTDILKKQAAFLLWYC